MKEKNTLGVLSLVFGILAFIFSIFFIISIPLAITSIITGSIALAKKKKKGKSIVGIILSSLSICFCVLLIVTSVILYNKIKNDPTGEVEENLMMSAYELSKGNFSVIGIDSNFNGNTWKLSDGTILKLKSNGTYYLYKNETDKKNYSKGKYIVKMKDEAVNEINDKYGNENKLFDENDDSIKPYIYYLELDNNNIVTDGKKEKNTQTIAYGLFITALSEEISGFNLKTLDTVNFTKIK